MTPLPANVVEVTLCELWIQTTRTSTSLLLATSTLTDSYPVKNTITLRRLPSCEKPKVHGGPCQNKIRSRKKRNVRVCCYKKEEFCELRDSKPKVELQGIYKARMRKYSDWLWNLYGIPFR